MAEDIGPETQTAALAALELVPFAMVIADGSAQVRAVNRRWMELTGLTRPNSLGHGWLSVLEPDARARLREDVVHVAAEGRTSTADYLVAGPHGSRWARWWVSRHELNGNPLVAIAAADVNEDYARQANLYHLATHDSLTGLINRSHFIEQIEQALRRNQRQSRHVGVVYVDLDGFKRLNDQGGHALGDRVLFAIGARLRHAVRTADLVARIGGDEFAVLCEGLSAAEQAEVVAGRIAAALNEAIELDGHRWPVSASVGAAVDQGSPDSAEDLVDRADRAMYTVKLTRRSADETEEQGAPSPDDFPASSLAPDIASLFATTPPPAKPAPLQTEATAPANAATPSPGPAPTTAPPAAPSPSAPQPAAASPSAPSHAAPSQAAPSPAESSPEESSPGPAPAAAPAPNVQQSAVAVAEDEARLRLMDDVVSLRQSLESIRSMLDRLLASDTGVIDIRERQDVSDRD